METLYEYVELKVAYPGHPTVRLIEGIHKSGNLKCIWDSADGLFNRRDRYDDGRQEQVYRLPLVNKIWEVLEEIGGLKKCRYVTVAGGALRRLTYDAVASVLRGKMSMDDAVSLCRHLSVGPDYADSSSEDDD